MVLACFGLKGQPPIDWEENYGGAGKEWPIEGGSFYPTADGGIVGTGFSDSADVDVTGNYGGTDVWVVKVDSSGALEWEQNYGGSNNDDASTIRQTNDGGYIVGGTSESSDQDVGGNYGGEDYWVLKLDSMGVIEWEQNYGGSKNDRLRTVRQTLDGGFILGGHSFSDDSTVSGNYGDRDAWIVKLDPLGNIEWEQNYGGSKSDFVECMEQTSDKGFIVAAPSRSDDFDVTGNHGSKDFWVLKLDSLGNIEWEDHYGGSGTDDPQYVQHAPGSGFIIAGGSTSNDNDVSGNNGGNDYWVVKLDTLGNLVWEANYGGSNDEEAACVETTPNGNLLIGGDTRSSDGDVPINYGKLDHWILELDPNGNLIWSGNYGGSDYDRHSSVFPYQGGIGFGGYAQSSDQDVASNNGDRDYWFVRLQGPCDTMWVQEQPQDDTVCIGDSALFIAQEGSFYSDSVTYEWELFDGSNWTPVASGDSLYVPNVTQSDSGKLYRCILFDPCGNTDTTQSAELVVPSQVYFSTQVEDVSCFGGSDGAISFDMFGGIPPYKASIDSGNSFSNFKDSTHTDSNLSAGGYMVMIEDSLGCESWIQTDTIQEPSELIADAGSDSSLCPSDSVQLGGNPTAMGGVGGYSYAWSPSTDLSSTSIDTPLAYPDSSLSYRLILSDSNQCRDTAFVQLQVNRPDPGLDDDTARCNPSEPLKITADNGFVQYQWSNGDSTESTTVASDGTYWVNVKDSTGCWGSDSITVGDEATVSEICGDLRIYNAFSPTRNGVNDKWIIEGIALWKENKVRIMNRWGNQVREFQNYDNQEVVWKGKGANGNSLATGTYYYLIEGINAEGVRIKKTGWVQITR